MVIVKVVAVEVVAVEVVAAAVVVEVVVVTGEHEHHGKVELQEQCCYSWV